MTLGIIESGDSSEVNKTITAGTKPAVRDTSLQTRGSVASTSQRGRTEQDDERAERQRAAEARRVAGRPRRTGADRLRQMRDLRAADKRRSAQNVRIRRMEHELADRHVRQIAE